LLALQVDQTMHEKTPAGWRGDEAKERTVQNFLYPLMQKDREATMKLFELLKNQPDYP
jgi:type I restriction enzyme R subunit